MSGYLIRVRVRVRVRVIRACRARVSKPPACAYRVPFEPQIPGEYVLSARKELTRID